MKAKADEQLLYGTSHAAGLTGCDPSTLRDYANRGIVSPMRASCPADTCGELRTRAR